MDTRQPVSIDGIEFDALIDSQEEYTATVPSYPVDSGASVSDNVSLDPMELTLTLYLTATPVTWSVRHGTGKDRLESVCNQLIEKYKERDFLEVVTMDKTYSNMVIKSIQFKKSEEIGIAREVPITLVQVTTTSSQAVDIPSKSGKSGATKKNTGKANTGSASVSGSAGGSSGSSGSSGGGSGETAEDNRTPLKKAKDGLEGLASGVLNTVLGG